VSLPRQDVRTGPTVMVADRYSVYADQSLAFPEIWDLAPYRCSKYGSGSSNSHKRTHTDLDPQPFYQCCGSVTFWCASVPLSNESGSGSNSGSGTLDPTPFFFEFKDAKKTSVSFLITYPQAHYLQS
jgi:hypothetical protein